MSVDLIRWLHLSDFHVGKDDYGQRQLFSYILKNIRTKVRDGEGPHLVFITGDVANSGNADQYELFEEEFLQPLRETVGEACADQVYIVPGNHDVDRTQCEAVQTHGVLSHVARFLDPTDDGLKKRKVILDRFEAFARWDSGGSANDWLYLPEGALLHSVEICQSRIGILGLNTAWLSCDDQDRHKLSAGKGIIESGLKKLEDCDFRIVLGHHPIDWFLDDELDPIRSLFGQYNVLYLHGHLHKTQARLDASVGIPFRQIQSGAAFQAREDEQWVNRFLWCSLDLGGKSVLAEPLKWSRDAQLWKIDHDAFLPKHRVQGQDLWALPCPENEDGLVTEMTPNQFTRAALRLSDDWFGWQVQTNIDNLGNRYDPHVNLQLNIAASFDGLARNGSFRELATYEFDEFFRAVNRIISRLSQSDLCPDLVGRMEEELLRLEKCYVQFQSLKLAPIEIGLMMDANKQLSDLLYQCDYAISDMLGEKKISQSRDAERALIYEALAALRKFVRFMQSPAVSAANTPVILLTGDAGTGKSHLLADVAKKIVESGRNAILLLGQHFTSEEAPWTQILRNLLRFDCNERELLEELNARAKAQGCRILFIIDAINEGRGRYFWPAHIRGFISSFSAYPWLAVVLSVRTTYVDLLTPENLIPKEAAIRIRHQGFSDIEYEASGFFFRQYGIEEPGTPLLSPEFGNPLFLKIFCEGLRRAGLTRIPQGHAGITQVIEFFLDNVNKRLSDPAFFDYPKGINLVKKVVYRILEAKLQADDGFLTYEGAYTLANEELSKVSTKKHFLDALISEGVLGKDLFWRKEGTPDEGVYLTYERFEDLLTVSLLLDKYLDKKNPKQVFQPDGNLRRYIDRPYASQGVLESLAIQVPERIGMELHELLPDDSGLDSAIAEAFVQSLLWRRRDTITPRVSDIVRARILHDEQIYEAFFEVVYSVALDPEHPFNAQFLHEYLMPLSLADRDSEWTTYLHDKNHRGSAIRRLIDWALMEEGKGRLSKQSRLLGGKALAWLLPSTDIELRDLATKGLVALFEGEIPLLKSLIESFEDVNDAYVLERMFAAGYGAVLRSGNLEGLVELSSHILEKIFLKETVYPNVLVRDYARNIIEYAVYKRVFELNESIRIIPPYRSSFPNNFPTNEEIDRRYHFDYNAKDFKEHYWSQNEIIRSMTTEYGRGVCNYGDFGRYTFQSHLHNWDSFDPQDLSNYACELIFEEYGYDVEKHGKFDRHASLGSRQNNEKERIGKKYQWMALYEVLARISDNHEMRDESSGWGSEKKYVWYEGTWEPSVRNIDPTLVPTRSFSRSEMPPTANGCEWLRCGYDSWEDEAKDWIISEERLPEPKELITRTDPDGCPWIVLDAQPDWKEPVPLGAEQHVYPRKRLWYQLTSYLVSDSEAKTVISWTQGAHLMGRHFPEGRSLHQVFSREMYWSPAYHCGHNADPDGNNWRNLYEQEYDGPTVGKVIPTADAYEWGTESRYQTFSSYMVPNEFMYRHMNLSYAKRTAEWNDSHGNMVVFDPSVRYGGPPCLVVRKDVLLEFLKRTELTLFWTLLGQKTMYGWDAKVGPNWLELSGTFILNEDEVVGDVRKFIAGVRRK